MSIKELWSHWELSAADPPKELRYNTAMIVKNISWCENCATNQMVHWAFAVFSVFPPLASFMKISLNFSSFLPKKSSFFSLLKRKEKIFSVRNSIIMKFIWDLLVCKCKTLEVSAEVNRWPFFSLAQPNPEGLFGLLTLFIQVLSEFKEEAPRDLPMWFFIRKS